MIRESSALAWNNVFSAPVIERLPNMAIISAINRQFGNVVREISILEVGPGEGNEALELARNGARVSVLDFSAPALEKIKKRAHERKVAIQLIHADSRAIPIPENRFDLTYSQGLMEHWQPMTSLLKEQIRVTKSGGTVLVDVPQLFSVQAPIKALLMSLNKWPYGWERNYTTEELQITMCQQGLRIVDTYAWGIFPPFGLSIRKNAASQKGGPTKKFIRIAFQLAQHLERQPHRGWLAQHTCNCIGVVGIKK
jgi:ubiquinone/menaquinone biosynthesis C-methylase UbiE